MSDSRVNRLAAATSPYLLQHAHNPVDWYPWGEEALARAQEEDRPIFLSIGYAACHWCHVMERESFESEEVAEILNREFVAIKVDREERPDLDEIYMTATQLLTHSGGWPMSVFLTPERKPFYAGTYFPPEDRWGRPGFKTLLTEIAKAWKERRTALLEQAERVSAAVEQVTSGSSGQGVVNATLLANAVRELAGGFDRSHGGFGSAPKFPPSMRLELMMRCSKEDAPDAYEPMVRLTLDQMARGGMYDQVGGGFHRYSVDERWLVPHFEKMLYDNSLLARVYALAYERYGYWYYERVGREILDYVLREMTDPDGGLYSTTDADSEGEEGKFFVWGPEEVLAVLGPEDGELFCRVYDVKPGGNFEGHSIPNLLRKSLEGWAQDLGTEVTALDSRLAVLRRKLWQHREHRVHPLLDDKILSGWNGLMIRALAEGYRVFRDERYREGAERAAAFVLSRMRDGDQLLRSYRRGQAALNAYQEDYAYLAVALLELHLVTGSEQWRKEGLALVDAMDRLFWDEASGGYFFTSHDHETLIARSRSFQDNATPSGNSMAALALIRAARITGDEWYRRRVAALLSVAAPMMNDMAAAFPNMLVAVDEYLREWPEGVRVPGSDAVELEGFLSRSAVRPGERFWVGVRMKIAKGSHINSCRPVQDYLVPTTLVVEEGPVQVTSWSYPDAVEYEAPFQPERLSVYSGTVLLGAELELAAGTPVGRLGVNVTLNLQPCDDQQCYPPMEARMRFSIAVTDSSGTEQYPEEFQEIRSRAEPVATETPAQPDADWEGHASAG